MDKSIKPAQVDKETRTMMRGSLSELEAVVAVAARGGFRAAARDLGISSSALSQQIMTLEARLGVRLFNRSTRSVVLSAAGERFVSEITPALAAIRGAIDQVDEHRVEPAGTLRINSSVGAIRMILAPVVIEYMRRFPQVSVEIVTDPAFVDINAKGFDAGIRLRETVPPDMVLVPISDSIHPAIVGSPEYFDKHGRPSVPVDLEAHQCIQARMANGGLYSWEFEGRGQQFSIAVPGKLTLDDSDLMLRAAREGAGLAYLNDWQVTDDLASGRLQRVLKDWTAPYPGLCLYYPGRRHVPAKLRTFVDLIRAVRRESV